MSGDFRGYEAGRIRYLMLKAIAEQDSGTWTAGMLRRHLSTKGYVKSPDYVAVQLRWLETEGMAVRLLPAGEELVVKLLGPGRRHLEGAFLIPGVHAPDDEEP